MGAGIMLKAAIVISSRSNSERFPFKSIKPLFGKPMILQIIAKCKMLGDYPIILGTTYEMEDNEMCKIVEAEEPDVEVFRGPARNLLLRHQMIASEFDLTHMVYVSGDSPFFDVEISKRLIEGMEKWPEADEVSGEPYDGPQMLEIQVAAPRSITYLYKCAELLEKSPRKMELQEAYWTAVAEAEQKTGQQIIDKRIIRTSDLITLSKTVIKTSVDFPHELWIANKVCEVLGKVPLGHREVLDGYKALTDL
jgi:hypothetical protein